MQRSEIVSSRIARIQSNVTARFLARIIPNSKFIDEPAALTVLALISERNCFKKFCFTCSNIGKTSSYGSPFLMSIFTNWFRWFTKSFTLGKTGTKVCCCIVFWRLIRLLVKKFNFILYY